MLNRLHSIHYVYITVLVTIAFDRIHLTVIALYIKAFSTLYLNLAAAGVKTGNQ
jgi:hypothetical protein